MYLNSFFTCFFLLVWNGKAHNRPKPVAPSASWLENYIKSNVGSTSTEIWDGEGRWGGGPKTNKRNAKALRERQGKVVVHTYKSTDTNTHIVTQMPSDWKLLAGNLWLETESRKQVLLHVFSLYLRSFSPSSLQAQ